MNFPTIFDWIEQFSFLQSETGTALLVGLAVLVTLAWDWRLALLGLLGSYLVAGMLFVDVLEPRLAMVKLLTGLFVCIILYITARQVNLTKPPAHLSSEALAALGREERVQLGPLSLPIQMPLRLALSAGLLVVVVLVGERPSFQLPFLTDNLAYLNFAVYGLGGLGLLGMTFNRNPLKVGMGASLFLMGFELFYSVLDPAMMVMGVLVVINLLVAVTISYLTQSRAQLPHLVDVS